MEQYTHTQLQPLGAVTSNVPEAIRRLPQYPVEGGNLVLSNPLGRGGFGEVLAADFLPSDGSAPFSLEPMYAAKRMGWGWEGTLTQSMATVTAAGFEPEAYLRSREDVEAMATKERELMGLGHPNIVPLAPFTGIDTYNNTLFYTMPYASHTLESWLKRQNRTTYETMLIVRQVAEGLQYAQDKGGIVHRDVKPDNIFLVQDEKKVEGFRAVIGDFGLAVKIDPKTEDEKEYKRVILGTPPYAPMEQRTHDGVVPASDQFALGVVAYRALTGVLPYDGEDSQIAKQVCALDTPPPSFVERTGLANSITRGFLEPVILRAIAKRPEDRHESVAAFGEALGGALASAGAECRKQAQIQYDRGVRAESSGLYIASYFEDALVLLDEAISANPRDLTALFQKAQSLMRLHCDDEATQVLDRIVQVPAQTSDEHLVQGRVFAHFGDHASAVQHYAWAEMENDAISTDLHRLAARSLEELGHAAESEKRTDDAIGLYAQAANRYRYSAGRDGISEAIAIKMGVLQQRIDRLSRNRHRVVLPRLSLVAVV